MVKILAQFYFSQIRSLMVGGFDRDDVRSSFGLSIDPCCLNVGMVKLNHIPSAPSHHEYDPAKRTFRDRIDSQGTRENPRTNATEPFRLYPFRVIASPGDLDFDEKVRSAIHQKLEAASSNINHQTNKSNMVDG
jgi:hypothetical protein